MTPLFLAQTTDSAAPNILFGFFGIGMLLIAIATIFWVWMIIDCATSTRLEGTQKIVWLLVIFFLHFIGAVVYFFAGRGGTPKALT